MNSIEEKIKELIAQYKLQKEEAQLLNDKIILEIRIDTLKSLLRSIHHENTYII